MRIIPFPDRGRTGSDETVLAELEAALSGGAEGPRAESWRELREDVRSLASPMAPGFERALERRIAETRAHSDPLRSGPRRVGRGLGSLRGHRRLVVALASGLAILLVAGLIVRPWSRGASPPEAGPASLPAARELRGSARGAESEPAVRASSAPAKSATTSSNAPNAPSAPSVSSATEAPDRVQQRAASISLGASSSEVQAVADGVARVATSAGGFVQSSHVQVQQGGSSGAELTLNIPSAKLDAVLASLGQLAPLRSESQSLQDITDSYEAARRQLADVNAERQALLRALSAASTQGQIDSLRERLSGVSHAIAQAHVALQTLSRRAGNSEVEVSVLGDRSTSSEGFTLHRGLHDAGKVLLVTLTVLLIAAAVLGPLALLIAATLGGRRAFRRYRRERILDSH